MTESTEQAEALALELPGGVQDLAAELMELADSQLKKLTGKSMPSSAEDVRQQILLPRLLEADWPRPRLPLLLGKRALHVDLYDEDKRTFSRLREVEPTKDPEKLANTAQTWRLPICPYRKLPQYPVLDNIPVDLKIRYQRKISELKIVDLTALWAGPLATGLLQKAGAQVTKIDPHCRPDGFRLRPALYQALNAGKQIIDLDLRKTADRKVFESLVSEADLLIESFSRRVMPNFSYSPGQLRELNPQLATLSLTAFPDQSPERDWLAYGGGIHAISGLGMLSGSPVPALIAYPDALAGMRAYGVALGLLGQEGPTPHVELSLLGTIAPLLQVG